MGAEKHTESRRSRIPPWPSIVFPKSFTLRSLLIADMTKPPAKPNRVINSDMARACKREKGVIHHRPVPTAVAQRIPPTKPSHVLLGETCGAIFLLPSILPHTY